jgi:hypothetical protein
LKKETWRERHLKTLWYRGDTLTTKITAGSKTLYKFTTWERITTHYLHNGMVEEELTTHSHHDSTTKISIKSL